MKKRKIQLFATLLLFIVSNVIFFVGGRKVQNRDISYEPVKVTVVSATQTRRTTGKYHSYTYDVVVEYEGKMYSNIDGIRTDSREFDWYMTGLAGICIFGFWHLICVVYEVDKKKKGERSI